LQHMADGRHFRAAPVTSGYRTVAVFESSRVRSQPSPLIVK